VSLRTALRKLRHPAIQRPPDFRGDYFSWTEALSASSGYDSPTILSKTVGAVQRVKSGSAAFERDSVAFDKLEYNWPFLAALMLAAARDRGRLNVLDFGGSLGSAYLQNRRFLSTLESVIWSVVEQATHVTKGKELLASDNLRFYHTVEDCIQETAPTTVVLGSVLQYLEHPDLIFRKLCALDSAKTIIIDRTPFWDGSRDMLCVQHVPSWIYDASYPSWIFSRDRFAEQIGPDWHVLERFESFDKLTGPVDLTFEGMILTRSARARE
jgi:putative methyltransferase (TIGR04325 family)